MTEAENNLKSNEFEGWIRKTVLFLSGQTVSLFGSFIVQYAIIWYITLTTESGIMMTISTVCGFLPQILISLFAGVWADRYDRKVLIILADVLIAFSTLVLAVLFMAGYDKLWLLFLVSGIRSLGAGIHTPAVSALLPQLVPMDKLMKVNSINGSIQSLIMLISPAVSGAILTKADLEITFFIDVVTAAIAITLILFLKVPPYKRAEGAENASYIGELKAGLTYAAKSVFVKEILIFYAFFMFLIVPAAFLTPLMVARTFGEEVWRLTLNEVLFSSGSIAGGVIIAVWGGFKNRIYTIAFSCIAFGVLTAALGLAGAFVIYLIIMFITGIFLPFFSTPFTTLLQELIEQDMQGRIFSLVQIVSTTSMPLGMILFGPIADAVKIEILLVITGVLLLLLGIWMFLNKRLVKSVEKPA